MADTSDERVFRRDTSWLIPSAVLYGGMGLLYIEGYRFDDPLLPILAAAAFAGGVSQLLLFFWRRARPVICVNRHGLVVFLPRVRYPQFVTWRAVDEIRRARTRKMDMVFHDVRAGKMHILLRDGGVIEIWLRPVRKEDREGLIEVLQEYHARFGGEVSLTKRQTEATFNP